MDRHRYINLYISFAVTASISCTVSTGGEQISFEKFYIEQDYGGNGKPGWVRAGDMDNDGDLDIVAGGGRALFVYENNGNARGWKRHGSLDSSGEIGSNGAELYDVDGDGDLDVVSAKFRSDLGWWENPGGRLRSLPWIFHALDSQIKDYFAHDIFLTDLDGDGAAEEFIFCLTKKGYWDAPVSLAWYRSGPDSGQPWPRHVIALDKPCPQNSHAGLDVADLDLDGRPDVIFSNGWFQAPEDILKGCWKWHAVTNIYGISNSLARDVDGDGCLDLVMSAGHHGKGVYWFSHSGDPKAGKWKQHTVDSTINHPEGLQVLDLDNDHDLDVIAAELFFGESPGEPGWNQEAHNIYLYRNLGGNPPAWKKINVAPDSYPSHQLQVVDVNRDGKMDILGSGCGFKILGYYENRSGQKFAK